jgi:hypothetical protein
MPRYEVSFVCEHHEVVVVTASSIKEARKKAREGRQDEIIEWHLEGIRNITDVQKIKEK